MSDKHLHCINSMDWGISLGCFIPGLYPPDQTLLAHSTDLKLFEDEVLWKIVIIKDNLGYFLCPFGFKCLSAYLAPPLAKQNLNCIYSLQLFKTI